MQNQACSRRNLDFDVEIYLDFLTQRLIFFSFYLRVVVVVILLFLLRAGGDLDWLALIIIRVLNI